MEVCVCVCVCVCRVCVCVRACVCVWGGCNHVRVYMYNVMKSRKAISQTTTGAQQSTYPVRNFDLTAIGLPPIIHTACTMS